MADELRSSEPADAGAPTEIVWDGPPSQQRGGPSGWYAVESDNSIRGWCRSRARPEQRFEVSILIDGTEVATVLADRTVERLAELGDGDGRFGFVWAIPAIFHDGAEHETSVEIVGESAATLKTKRASFAIRPGTPGPRATLQRIGAGGIEGVLTGPPGLRDELDVWLDGCVLKPDEFAVEWRWGERQTRPFQLNVRDHLPLHLLGRDLVVAYPGTTADEASSIAAFAQPTIRPVGDDVYEVAFGPGVVLPSGYTLRAEVHGVADDPSSMRCQLDFEERRARFSLTGADGQSQLRLRLLAPDGTPMGADIGFARSTVPRRLLPNGAFQRWHPDGPDGFELGPDIIGERGFYAFPPALKTQFGLSGALFAATLDPAHGEQLVLTGGARRLGGGERRIDVGLAFFARASRPTLVSLRLVDGENRVIAVLAATLGLRWKAEQRVVTLPSGPAVAARVELVAQPHGSEGPVHLEVAGLHCGDPALPGFTDDETTTRPPTVAEPAANLVVNAALTSWPSGLTPGARHSRFELAEGWMLANPGGGDVSAAAVPAPGALSGAAPGRYGLSLTLAAVKEPVRLEILLDTALLSGRGEVAFDAMLSPAPAAPADQWGFIDRIAVVRRTLHDADGAPGAAEAVVAVVARRISLTHAWERCRFAFSVSAAGEAGFDIPSIDDGRTEYLLTFEFRRPMTIALAGLELRLAAAVPLPSPAPLAFEDRAIRAQLAALRGIEHWRSPRIVRPAVRSPQAPSLGDGARWRWKAGVAAVEVAICVHDAADETLACLAALAEAGGVPHTVRVVDDASGEDTRQRIAAFVADRPWMTLDANPHHLGYTASANRAVLESRAEWVILLNSDTVVTPGWMEGLLEVGASDPKVALVGPVSNAATYQSVPELYDGTGQWAVNPLPPGHTPADMAALVAGHAERGFPETPLLNGFCTLIRRDAFVAAGGFNARAFPEGYGEENDLCLRLTKAGWRLRVADHVYVHHLKSRSFGPARRTELSRKGDAALRALHPDVDFAALGRAFLATPALQHLRRAVAGFYPQPALVEPAGEAA